APGPTGNDLAHSPGAPPLVVARYPQLRGDERLACRCWRFQSVRQLISDRRREPADIGAPPRQTGFPFPAGKRPKDEARDLWAEVPQPGDTRPALQLACLLPGRVPEKARRVPGPLARSRSA